MLQNVQQRSIHRGVRKLREVGEVSDHLQCTGSYVCFFPAVLLLHAKITRVEALCDLRWPSFCSLR